MDQNEIEALIQRVQQVKQGFTDIRRTYEELIFAKSETETDALIDTLWPSDVYQARMLATFLLGSRAAQSEQQLAMLRTVVSRDPDWRVQEILAQAFDQFCKDVGYETALPTITDWLQDEHPNVRRAVTEGLRIWTSKPYFKDHPDMAVRLLSALKADNSDYVRRSIGNAMRDISRKHPDLLRSELASWAQSDPHTLQTYKLASKFVK